MIIIMMIMMTMNKVMMMIAKKVKMKDKKNKYSKMLRNEESMYYALILHNSIRETFTLTYELSIVTYNYLYGSST
jgi:hypothetical protein